MCVDIKDSNAPWAQYIPSVRSRFLALLPLPSRFKALSSDVDPIRAHAYFSFDPLAEERH